MVRTCFVVLVIFLLPLVVTAAEKSDTSAGRLTELRQALVRLQAQYDSLKLLLQPSGVTEDDLDDLEAGFDRRLTALENKIDAVTRASAGTVLNPRMTAFINFAARGDTKPVPDASDPANETGDRPYLRTVEMELRNAVDPYAEAVTVISLENEAGKEFAIDAEEAYGLIKRIPLIESAPLGVKLKIGKFRAPLGTDNKIHMHDLPWTTRPLAIAKYLGTEHGNFFESGFNPTGVDLDFFLPDPIPGTTLEANADVVRGGDLALSTPGGLLQPAYLGHLQLSRDWSNEHLLILGASAYREEGISPAQVLGLDLTYRWAPSEQRESHSFVAGGELFAAKHTFADTAGAPVSNSPLGWFAYAQYQSSYWVYLGLRYDHVQEPVDDRLVTRAAAGYLSYYTTEFLRFRLGFEHRWSDLPADDNLNTGVFEVNFVFGSHPTEPYWVNR